MEHSPALGATVAPSAVTSEREGAPRGPRPRPIGPSAGSAGDAGAETRVSKPKRLKEEAKERAEKAEGGGPTLAARKDSRPARGVTDM